MRSWAAEGEFCRKARSRCFKASCRGSEIYVFKHRLHRHLSSLVCLECPRMRRTCTASPTSGLQTRFSICGHFQEQIRAVGRRQPPVWQSQHPSLSSAPKIEADPSAATAQASSHTYIYIHVYVHVYLYHADLLSIQGHQGPIAR